MFRAQRMNIRSHEDEMKPKLLHHQPSSQSPPGFLIHSFTGQSSSENFIGLIRYLIGLGKKTIRSHFHLRLNIWEQLLQSGGPDKYVTVYTVL